MKYLVLTALLAVAATPRIEADPYAKYDLIMDKAQANIEITKASIEQAKAMTDEKVEEVKSEIVAMEEEAETMQKEMVEMKQDAQAYKVALSDLGVDTSDSVISYSGVLWDAFTQYKSNGGEKDFTYFRLYIYGGQK